LSHITAGVEYALHSLLYLVGDGRVDRLASTKELAEFQNISPGFIAKIFTRLQKATLVISTEGVQGGFRLARKPSLISVWDVVVAVDGEKPLFDCREIRSKCAIYHGRPPGWTTTGVCSIHAIMLEAEGKMRSALKGHTLADIARKVEQKAGRSIGLGFETWQATK
jgi:Rrf2 family protein